MLMITIAMAGVAYMYISGIFTSKTGTIVEIDTTATSCSGTTITVYVRNTGTIAFSKALLSLSGTNSAGVAMTGGTCTAGTLNAGAGSSPCGVSLTGASTGNNRIVVSGPSNTVTGSVYCSG